MSDVLPNLPGYLEFGAILEETGGFTHHAVPVQVKEVPCLELARVQM